MPGTHARFRWRARQPANTIVILRPLPPGVTVKHGVNDRIDFLNDFFPKGLVHMKIVALTALFLGLSSIATAATPISDSFAVTAIVQASCQASVADTNATAPLTVEVACTHLTPVNVAISTVVRKDQRSDSRTGVIAGPAFARAMATSEPQPLVNSFQTTKTSVCVGSHSALRPGEREKLWRGSCQLDSVAVQRVTITY
jgi:hypothetical protein